MQSDRTIYRIKRSLRGCRLKPSFGLCLFEETGYCLDLFGFLIALPFLDRWYREPKEIMASWGACYFDRAIMLKWGDWTKFIYMPWSMDHVKWEVMQPDGKFVLKDRSYDGDPKDGRWVADYVYRYTLRNGEVQVCAATIKAERFTSTRPWLPWKRVQDSIDINFDKGVGERVDTWKGGVYGCGYDMLPGESALMTLRRMELERKF